MKSIIIQDDSIHKKLKILSAQTEKNITQLVEEAILDIVEKYRILLNSENTNETM
jgi:predicted transcriptional regulator